jgi:long-chain acyl-CoA synthetase
VNLGDIPRRNAHRHPHKPGIVFGEVSFSWWQVNQRVNRLANALREMGLTKGERVALLARNDHRYLEAYWGLAKAGLIAVPLNYRLLEVELVALLNHAQASALLIGPEYRELGPALSRAVHSVRRVIGLGDEYERLLDASSADEPPACVGEDDPFAILYTSGTTGLPKGAVVSHRNLENNVFNQALADGSRSDDVNLTATPLYHMGALFMATTYTYLGCTNVILPQFDPREVLRAIERERVTVCLLVPTMLNLLLHHEELDRNDLSSLRLVFYGGSVIPVPVLRRAIEALGCAFTQGYGLTETIEATFLVAADHVLEEDPVRERRLGSAGREAVNAEVRVVDEEGRELAPGEIGEIVVRGPSVIREYWRAPDETARAIRRGWFYTGDVGYLDEDGYLFVVDRRKDMIISGGTNIYPSEVEEVLYRHPAVLEAAVIGVPDEVWGESVKAVVALKPGRTVSEEELIDHCRQQLASYKKPRRVEFVASLPRNPSGKILKRELRAAHVQRSHPG